MPSRPLLAVAAALLLPLAATACLWDHDTLLQERARFPTALELITGKFLRHSPAFYEWRIRDRTAKLAAGPSRPEWHDDIAVAYSKLGRHAGAVRALEAKEKLHPGLYETASNLGTVLMLAGDLNGGLPHIDRALALNPDAHFGREKYQKWLAEYALTKRPDGKLTFPLQKVPKEGEYCEETDNFAKFLAGKLGTKRLGHVDAKAAVQGVLGMMRFAGHTSPLLLEALGDLLYVGPDISFAEAGEDAKQLAARAYLRAGEAEPGGQAGFRTLAEATIYMQKAHTHALARQVKLTEVEADLTREVADAAAWYAKLEANERGWVASGEDADARFAELYAAEPAGPAVIEVNTARDAFVLKMWLAGLLCAATAAAGTALTFWAAWRLVRRHRAYNRAAY